MASQKRKILFIDRDGTLIMEPEDQQIDAFEKLVFYPEVITYLGKIARELDYTLVMVTNQDGLGTASHPEANFWPVHNLMMATLESEGITFEEVIVDRTYASDNAPTRKPGTALLTHYMNDAIDLANSFVIGDRKTDVELAKNLSCRAIWINNQGLGDEEVNTAEDALEKATALKTASWKEIYEFLKLEDRTAQLERNTRETRIKISLNLDGAGHSEISTGLAFFDHMLDQLARHGQLDLKIHTEGDLHVDEHHTIEDTAIALGEVFALALGNKLGIERYGYQLPMDDCLASVSLDFGGRSWLVWETSFQREKIGDMPTEMFYHFFKSFADGARANLNIQAKGTNEHHKIEAVFKAFAKAIKMAVRRDPEHMILPSTKGML